MADKAPKTDKGSHYLWVPPSAGTWLQAGYEVFYAPGSVLPEKVAKGEHSESVAACIVKGPGKKDPSEPSERPWSL